MKFLWVIIVCATALGVYGSQVAHASVYIPTSTLQTLYHFNTSTTLETAHSYHLAGGAVPALVSPTFLSATGTMGDAASFNNTNAYTTSTWNLGSDTTATWGAFFNTTSTYSVDGVMIKIGEDAAFLRFYGNGNLGCDIQWSGGSAQISLSGAQFRDGNPHFVACRVQTSTLTMYVDGNTTSTTSFSGGPFRSGSQAFRIGNYTSGDYDFVGQMDEVFYDNSFLATSTLNAIWNSGAGSPICVTAGCDSSSTGTPAIASLVQYQLDGSTSLGEGGSTSETGVVLGATLTSSSSNNLKLQVQVSTSSSFSNAVTGTSSAVASGATTTVTIDGLSNATWYWRGRALDADTNATSSWVQFGASGTADYVIAAPAAVEISDGSVTGLWHLDGNGADSTNYGRNGTTSAVSWVSGKLGAYAASFISTSSSKIDLPSFTATATTLIAWIKTGSGGTPYVHLGNASPQQMLWLDTDGSGNIRLAEYDGGYSHHITSGTNYADNAWHLVIGTRDGTTACVYADNVYKGCSTISPSTTVGGDRNAIGYDRYNGTSYYSGLIDEVAVLNFVISTSTRGALWNGGAGKPMCTTAGCAVGYTPLSGTITTSTTWTTANDPYVISSTVTIATNTTVIVEPGVIVKFKDDQSLIVNGTLDVRGTSSTLAYFTSWHDDAIGGDTNGNGTSTSAEPGKWGSIEVGSGASTTLGGVLIRFGGSNNLSSKANVYNTGGTVNVIYGAVAESWKYGLRVTAGTTTIRDSQIYNNDDGIWITGGTVTMGSSSIFNSSIYGAYRSLGPTDDLQNNFWGGWSSSAGPASVDPGPYASATNPDGVGDEVSSYVDYDPYVEAFLLDPFNHSSSSVSIGSSTKTIRWGGTTASSSVLNVWGEAIGTWNNATSHLIAIVDASSSPSSSLKLYIEDVNWNWATSAVAVYTPYVTSTGMSRIQINYYWFEQLDQNKQKQALMHELGHALGLGHGPTYQNVMYAIGDYWFTPVALGTQDYHDYNFRWGNWWAKLWSNVFE